MEQDEKLTKAILLYLESTIFFASYCPFKAGVCTQEKGFVPAFYRGGKMPWVRSWGATLIVFSFFSPVLCTLQHHLVLPTGFHAAIRAAFRSCGVVIIIMIVQMAVTKKTAPTQNASRLTSGTWEDDVTYLYQIDSTTAH